MSAKVTIIMNCYNGEKYLKESLLSVLSQTYKNWELIFWDNQSIDNSKKIFKTFKDKRFKYFFAKKFTNLYIARNLAISKATGQIICFLDVDDLWLPDKLKFQVSLFKDKKVNLVYGNFLLKNYLGILKKKKFTHKILPTGYITNYLLKEYCVGLLTIAIRRKSISKYKDIFNPRYNLISDFDFVLNFSLNNKFECVQKPIAIYREHIDQQQRKYFFLQAKNFCDWYLVIKKKILNKHSNFKNLEMKYIFYRQILKIQNKNFFKTFFYIVRKKNLKVKLKLKLLLIVIYKKLFINYFFKTH